MELVFILLMVGFIVLMFNIYDKIEEENLIENKNISKVNKYKLQGAGAIFCAIASLIMVISYHKIVPSIESVEKSLVENFEVTNKFGLENLKIDSPLVIEKRITSFKFSLFEKTDTIIRNADKKTEIFFKNKKD